MTFRVLGRTIYCSRRAGGAAFRGLKVHKEFAGRTELMPSAPVGRGKKFL